MTTTWLKRRVERDRALGLRLTLASVAALLVLVPFMLLLMFVETSFQPLIGFDMRVANALHAYAREEPGFTTAMQVWTDVFAPLTWRVLVGAAAVYLFVKGAPRLAAWAVTTITVGGLIGVAVKEVVERARPDWPDPVSITPGTSFPSGHTLNAALGAGVLVLLVLPMLSRRGRVIAWLLAAFMAISMAFTRVALGVHWFSDVLAGIILGAAVIAATTAAFETWRRHIGRRASTPHTQGVEPEAEREINPRKTGGIGGDHGH